jgi:hypothetical protein
MVLLITVCIYENENEQKPEPESGRIFRSPPMCLDLFSNLDEQFENRSTLDGGGSDGVASGILEGGHKGFEIVCGTYGEKVIIYIQTPRLLNLSNILCIPRVGE